MLPLMLFAAGIVAHAQDVPVPDIDAQLYRIPIDTRYALWTEDSEVGPAGSYSLRAGYHYANKPLIYVPYDETQSSTSILENVSEFDVGVGVSTGPIRLGVNLPVFFATDGSFVDANAPTASGFGDIDVEAKIGLNEARRRTSNESGAPGVALAIGVGLPTGGGVGAPVTSKDPTFTALAVVDGPLGPEGKTHLAGNVGFGRVPRFDLGGSDLASVGTDTGVESLVWNNLVIARLGVGQEMGEGWGLTGDLSFTSEASALFQNMDGQPLELLGGVWTRLGRSGLVLNVGGGFSPYKAVGAAQGRAIGFLTYQPKADAAPVATPRDVLVTLFIEDHDGEPVSAAKTEVDLEEGREYGGHTLSFTVHPGTYSMAATADGYKPIQDTFVVPDTDRHEIVKVMDGLIGRLRVNVVDNDGDPIEDAWFQVGEGDPTPTEDGTGELESDPGEFLVAARAEGYRPNSMAAEIDAGALTIITIPLDDRQAYATSEAIIITDKVHFDFDKYTIRRDSFAILDDVVEVLVEHPNIKRVRIEGHTDSRGSDAYNKDLSQNRARSVRNYLVERGISPDRLDFTGFGENLPIDPSENEIAWAKNRRVEFKILKKGPDGYQMSDMTQERFIDKVDNEQQ